MSYTLGDIATRVRTRVGDSSYSSSETVNFINDAVNDVFNEYRLPFMQTSQTYTVSTSSSDVTNGAGLPDDFVQAIELINTTSGKEDIIPYVDYDDIDRLYPDADDTTANPSGDPLYWYKYGETIRVYPTPSSAYTVQLRYYKRPAVLSDNTHIPALPQEFEELIILGAAYRIYQTKDMWTEAGILENKYFELLQKLVNRYSSPQIGSVRVMGINRSPAPYRALDTYRRRLG